MPPVLYCFPASPFCRSVLLTARALGLELIVKPLDMFNGEHETPEFLKMNPQHVLPTLVDGDFVLWECRAIQIYLVERYGHTDALYPADPAKRALVNMMLFFDVGTLFQFALDAIIPVMCGEPRDFGLVKRLEVAIGQLDDQLATSRWAAADHLTIADHALACSMNYIEALGGICLPNYRNLRRWYSACKKTMDGWKEINDPATELCVEWFNINVRRHQEKLYDVYYKR